MKTFLPNFEKRGGLVTVIVQDAESKEVLMLAYANQEALRMTLVTRKATYWSTSRKELWVKGQSSKNTQEIMDVLIDCDGDALVYLVHQKGEGACHTNARSCFFRSCIDARQIMDAPKKGEKDVLGVVDTEDLVEKPEKMISSDPLRFLLPSGSMSTRVIDLLNNVGYPVHKPDRTGSCGTFNGIEFYTRDRRTIPYLIGSRFDAGITGKDLLWEARKEGQLRAIADLCFSRASDAPVRWVLCTRDGKLPTGHIRIGCELTTLAQKILPVFIADYTIVKIEGSEEMAIMDGLCDAVLVLTETGSSLTENGLQIVEGCEELMVSVPQILAAQELPPQKAERLAELSAALRSAVGSAAYVMVTCDILAASIQGLQLPSTVSPTVMPLRDAQWAAVQVCFDQSKLGAVLVQLEASGAKSIVVQKVDGYLQ